MLIAFGGLPGSGKSTIAALVAAELGAVYLRIDTIEQAIRNAKVLAGDVEGAGYAVARELAIDNLRLGRTVIVDCVNPLAVTREMFQSAGAASGVEVLSVEVRCSDSEEHRRRVETRTIQIAGLRPPTWEEIDGRDYEPWRETDLTLDTATMTAKQAAALVCREAVKGLGSAA